jgi:hypothetical protein
MKNTEHLEDFDFGFNFVEHNYEEVKEMKDSLIKDYHISRQQVENLKQRLQMMYDSILPFLDNLCKNPEKSTIHWPNRVEKIEAYKLKLKKILEG